MNDGDHEVFIQLNKTRAQSAIYRPQKSTPHSAYDAVQSRNDQNKVRTLPFEEAGYVWRPEGPGEMGKGVEIPAEDKGLADSLFTRHQFNVLASDRMALNRSLPDKRPPRY